MPGLPIKCHNQLLEQILDHDEPPTHPSETKYWFHQSASLFLLLREGPLRDRVAGRSARLNVSRFASPTVNHDRPMRTILCRIAHITWKLSDGIGYSFGLLKQSVTPCPPRPHGGNGQS